VESELALEDADGLSEGFALEAGARGVDGGAGVVLEAEEDDRVSARLSGGRRHGLIWNGPLGGE